MSCVPCGPTGPAANFCGPPNVIAAIVAGPVGPTGPTGPAGPISYGVTGPTGPTGPQGVPGAIGLIGASGPTGPAGTNGAPIGFFTGVLWAPAVPTDDLVALVGGKTLDFGTVPFASGSYLFSLKMQIGWNAGAVGPNNLNGSAQLLDNTTVLETVQWGRAKSEASGYQYADAQSLDFWFLATVTSGNNLYLKASSQFYLLGAQLTAFPLPSNIITSPGFIG